jgi:hypothetical protein
MSNIEWDIFDWDITLTEPLLGGVPKRKDVYTRYVAMTTGGAEDETFEEVEEAGWTGFYTDEKGRPCLMDYQIKGYLKEVANILRPQLGVPNLRSHVENAVYVFPRKVVIAEHVADEPFERPMRVMTVQGPRTTVARSDYVDAGASFSVELRLMRNMKVTEDILRTIVGFGEIRGLGRWRNGSYGRFVSKLTKREDGQRLRKRLKVKGSAGSS